MQDFPPILKASEDAGASWVVVEQDNSVGRTSLEAAEMSREYLRSQGY
jgi:sugar phosphate isomerase/epimerase